LASQYEKVFIAIGENRTFAFHRVPLPFRRSTTEPPFNITSTVMTAAWWQIATIEVQIDLLAPHRPS
jgi:hypothetical protein